MDEDFYQSATEAAVAGLRAFLESETMHQQESSVKSGLSPVESEARDIAVNAARKEIDQGGGMDRGVNAPVGGVTAFKVVWDVESQCWTVHEPKVVYPDGTTATPDCAALTASMDVYLHVWTEDGSYRSFIGGADPVSEEERSSEWARKFLVAKIGPDAPDCVQQVHVGTFTVPGESRQRKRSFDIEGGRVVRCSIPCPIEMVSADDYEIDATGGNIYLHVRRQNGQYLATVDQTYAAPSYDSVTLTLYEKDGDEFIDFRPGVVPVLAL